MQQVPCLTQKISELEWRLYVLYQTWAEERILDPLIVLSHAVSTSLAAQVYFIVPWLDPAKTQGVYHWAQLGVKPKAQVSFIPSQKETSWSAGELDDKLFCCPINLPSPITIQPLVRRILPTHQPSNISPLQTAMLHISENIASETM